MASPHRTYSELIFAHNAPRLRQAGFAVLPANGKKPRRTGYRKWRHAPDLSVVSMWAEQDPSADIVYVPGLSRARGGDHGIVVIDGDEEEACAQIVEVFGDTPGKVKTRRGYHGLYRATGLDLGKLTSLKKFGINADIKHGNSIVVAPPSSTSGQPWFRLCLGWLRRNGDPGSAPVQCPGATTAPWQGGSAGSDTRSKAPDGPPRWLP